MNNGLARFMVREHLKTQTQDKRIKQKTVWSEPPIKRKEDFENELFE
jgi:hypothetical protein